LFKYAVLFAYGFSLALCFLSLSALRDAMLDPESVVSLKGKVLGGVLWTLLGAMAISILFIPLSWMANLAGASLVGPTVAFAGLLFGYVVAHPLNARWKRFFAKAIGSKPAVSPSAGDA
jgi:hypothetical protein